MSEFLNHLLERAAKLQKTIALAEGSDPRVAEAAEIFTREKIGKIVLIGNEAEIRAKYPEFKFHNVTFRDPGAGDKYVEKYAKKLYELRKEKGMTEDVATAWSAARCFLPRTCPARRSRSSKRPPASRACPAAS